HTDWMFDTAVIVCVAPNPVKFSFEVYDAWHSLSTQFGVPPPHCVDIVHAAPLLTPSGSSMPPPTGCWTIPHTGHAPMPEQSGSAAGAAAVVGWVAGTRLDRVLRARRAVAVGAAAAVRVARRRAAGAQQNRNHDKTNRGHGNPPGLTAHHNTHRARLHAKCA